MDRDRLDAINWLAVGLAILCLGPLAIFAIFAGFALIAAIFHNPQ